MLTEQTTRAEFDALLPPPPAAGAVHDAKRVHRQLSNRVRALREQLEGLRADDVAYVEQLLDASIAGRDLRPLNPAHPHIVAALEYELNLVERATAWAVERMAEAGSRDPGYRDWQARTGEYRRRWQAIRHTEPEFRQLLCNELEDDIRAANLAQELGRT